MVISYHVCSDLFQLNLQTFETFCFRIGLQRGAIERWQATGLNTSIKILPQFLKTAGYKNHLVRIWYNFSSFISINKICRLANGTLATVMKTIFLTTGGLTPSLDSTTMWQTIIQGIVINHVYFVIINYLHKFHTRYISIC